jgi:KUP system potassium uptake protein
VLFVTIQTLDEPEVGFERRAEVSEMAPGIHRVILRYGFMESPDIPAALQNLQAIHFDPMQASYFLGRDVLVPALVPRMPRWRFWLFLLLARNAVSATDFFRIPYDRVVELGARVAI